MLTRLAWLETRRQPLALLALAFMTGIGSCVLTILALAGVVTSQAVAQLSGTAALDQVLVVQSLQPEDKQQPLSFERQQLSSDTLQQLASLPGCVSCDVLHAVPVPATLRISMAGLLDNDQFVGLFALEGDLVPPELQAAWQADEGAIPLLMHPQVIPLFNTALAERYHLPQVSPELLLGAGVTLDFGSDRFMSIARPVSLPARFAGYHPLVPLWGVAMPRHRAEALLAQTLDNRPKGAGPIEAHLRFASNDHLLAAEEAISTMGLRLGGASTMHRAISRSHQLFGQALVLGGAALLVMVVVATLALLVGISNERRQSITLYRLNAAHWGHLVWIFASGPALTVLLASTLAIGITALLTPSLLATAVNDVLDHTGLDTFTAASSDRVAPPSLATIPATWLLPVGLAVGVVLAVMPVMAWAMRRSLWRHLRQDHC